MRVWALVAVCGLGGCGAKDLERFVDGPPPDGLNPGQSSNSLLITAIWQAETAPGLVPTESRLFVFLADPGGTPVLDALIEVTIEGDVPGVAPHVRNGVYAVDIGAWPAEMRIDIHRGPDFLEGLVLTNLPLHEVAIDPQTLAVGSPIHVSWAPHGVPQMFAGVGVRTEGGAYEVQDYDLADDGDYQSDRPVFSSPGPYWIEMDRYYYFDIHSLRSGGLVDLYVIEQVDIPAPPTPDAGPVDAASDAASDAADGDDLDGAADAPP